MKAVTKIAIAAAFVLASAAPALAQNGGGGNGGPMTAEEWQYLRNPAAPVPAYKEQRAAPRGQLLEGRNVGEPSQQQAPAQAPSLYNIPSEQHEWYDRGSSDFNN